MEGHRGDAGENAGKAVIGQPMPGPFLRRAVHTLGVGGLSVLGEVDSGDLVLALDAEPEGRVDDFADDERHDEGVYRDHRNGEGLLAQQ